jgi:MFS family permease
MNPKTPSFQLIALLFAFIFGGAIVGETVALSMVVSVAGSEVLSRLYLLNGLLLFLLPPLFFRNIDRINRARLLSGVLLVSCVALSTLFCALQFGGNSGAVSLLLRAIYPFSYLSKTILFLSFWTLANDCYNTGEAKKGFPLISAWGFVGALAGAWVARILLEVVNPEIIIALWALAYLVGFFLAGAVGRAFRGRLMPRERIRVQRGKARGMLSDVEDVLSIKLVRLISVLYFLVFLAVFSIDYAFWHRCHRWFSTSTSLASFQFTFYLTHGIITIIGLWFIMPKLIARLGFTRIFTFLPLVLFAGSSLLLALDVSGILSGKNAFFAFTGFQLMRHVMFEIAFSPVYQMFFASVSRDKRGRAKTMLEGVIKPAAIMGAGGALMFLPKVAYGIPVMIVAVTAIMVYVVTRVRITYMEGLVPDIRREFQPSDIITQIGSHYDQKILSLVRSYSHARDADLRALAVKILAQLGTRQALKIVIDIFESEKDRGVREMVARSLTNFYWYETRHFIERLLTDANSRLRANAISSLNGMNCAWKWRLRDSIRSALFAPDLRVQIEAAQYLWQTGDINERKVVDAFLTGLLGSKNANKRSAGLYLIGKIQPDGWESALLDSLSSASRQVFAKSIEVIVRCASRSTRIEALRIVEGMSRDHIALAGKAVVQAGSSAAETVGAFLETARNKRMIFEMIHALRIILDSAGGRKGAFPLSDKANQRIESQVYEELREAYRDATAWNSAAGERGAGEACLAMLDDALREKLFRTGEYALDALAVVERKGVVAWGRRDLDLGDRTERGNMVEIVESYGPTRLGSLIIPILEFESWEHIAKVAKHQFRYKEVVGGRLEERFINSSNKWICLCALYCLHGNPASQAIISSQRARLRTLSEDSHVQLARAAASLIEKGSTEDVRRGMNTFELLETVLFFKKSPLFRNVPAEKLMGLAEISSLATFARDEVISSEGEISDHLYIVKTGSLKIVKMKSAVRTILSIIRPGEAYGEIGLFNQAPRSATSIANEPCEVFVIQRHALKRLLMDIPEIAFNFLAVFSEKLRKSGEEVALLHTTLSNQIGKGLTEETPEKSFT